MNPILRRSGRLAALLLSCVLAAPVQAQAPGWATAPPIPQGAEEVYGIASGGKLYVCGGYRLPDSGTATWIPMYTAWEYDPKADSWRALAPVPQARGAANAAVLGGKIHLVGGATLPADLEDATFHPSRNVSVGTHEVYDPATDSWSTRAAGVPAHAIGAAAALAARRGALPGQGPTHRDGLWPLKVFGSFRQRSSSVACPAPMKIAVFTKNLGNPAYAAARLGAERAAARWGAQVRHYVPETADDPVQQSALISQALATRPDAIVFTPVHPTQVNDAIAAIGDAGVPIFGFVNRMPAGRCVSYVGSSDTMLAEDIAEFLFRHLQGRGEVAVVEGPPGSVTSLERVAAFAAAAVRHPGIRLVAHCSGAYLREPARVAFAGLLREHPGIDAVLAANDIMAIGVLDALAAAQRDAVVVGVNAIPQAVQAIGAGRMLATADFDAMQMCFLATECAIRHGRGEAVPAEIELPVAIVHAGNWRQWNLPYEQRRLLTLGELGSCSVTP